LKTLTARVGELDGQGRVVISGAASCATAPAFIGGQCACSAASIDLDGRNDERFLKKLERENVGGESGLKLAEPV
jgi:hypothetical protein